MTDSLASTLAERIAEPKDTVFARRKQGHLCGSPGATHHQPGPDPPPQGRPIQVSLSRPERLWIQRRIEKLGEAADPMECRLLEKVRL